MDPFNCLLLLKHRSFFSSRLATAKRLSHNFLDDHCLEDDHYLGNDELNSFAILVDGLLNDPQIYQSYGFQQLYAQNYLGIDDWEWFHQADRVDPVMKDILKTINCKEMMPASDDKSTASWLGFDTPRLAYDTMTPDPVETGSMLHRDYAFLVDGQRLTSGVMYSGQPALEKAQGLIIRLSDVWDWDWDRDWAWGDWAYATRGDRNAALRGAIFGRDIARVREIFKCVTLSEERMDSQPSDAEVLLVAIQQNCIRSTILLLEEGYDVNCEINGDTPLSAAVVNYSDSLARLLLAYGADKSAAISNLQRRLEASRSPLEFRLDRLDLAIEGRLNFLKQLRAPHLRQKTSRPRARLGRLRKNFWKEHSSMINAVQRRPRSAQYWWFHYNSEDEKYYQSFGIEGDVHNAWTAGVSTMHTLCRGESPGTACEIIKFLALAKSMMPILNSHRYQDLEAEFFQDLPRWCLLFNSSSHHDAVEQSKFTAGLKVVWGIEPMELRPRPIQDQERFAKELLNIQNLAHRLFNEFFSISTATSPKKNDFQSVQSRWQASKECLDPHSTAHSFTQPKRDHTTLLWMLNWLEQPLCMTEAEEIRRPPDEDFLINNQELVDSCAMPNSALVLVLAGTIFAIVLAFLILLHSSASASKIGSLFPLTATVSAAINSGVVVCKETSIIQRTATLLKLILNIGAVIAHEFTPTTVVKEGDRQPNTESPLSAGTEGSSMDTTSEPSRYSGESSSLQESRTPSGSTSSARIRKRHFCRECDREFSSSSNLGKHDRDMHKQVRHKCAHCSKTFQRNTTRIKHEREKHGKSMQPERISTSPIAVLSDHADEMFFNFDMFASP
ncbi:hypothetical protein F5Y16DRAFT_382013 [Xylariaceae sp. FL0255]|nr:hypothetical protein F5Y16DRAFT_382013 [Xylariaceae sp. FL0255]